MPTKADHGVQQAALQEGRSSGERLAPRLPSRLGWWIFGGILLEAVSMVAIIVLLAGGQFSWLMYALGMLSVLIPLGLLTRGFRFLVLDEAHAQGAMSRQDQHSSDAFSPDQVVKGPVLGQFPDPSEAGGEPSVSQGTREKQSAAEREVALR